jgi:uncharacterized protein
MQKAITLLHRGFTLRGMEHIPEHLSGAKLPAVILFHGFTGTKLEPHRFFLKISRALEGMGYACYRFDFLGSGESDGNFEEMTVSKEVSEANTILDSVLNDPRVDANHVYLMGLSMGGLVASLLAGDRPEDVCKLVLLAPAGNMYEIINEKAGAIVANPSIKVIDYGGNVVGRDLITDLQQIDVFRRARNYTGNVLLIHGTGDGTVPWQVSYWYQQLSYGSRATIDLIEGANHTFDSSQWESQVIQKVGSFLQQ